jgi:hypothetical protein
LAVDQSVVGPSGDLPGELRLSAEEIAEPAADLRRELGSVAVDQALAVEPTVTESARDVDGARPDRIDNVAGTPDEVGFDSIRIGAPADELTDDDSPAGPMTEDEQQDAIAYGRACVATAREDFVVTGDPEGRIDNWMPQGMNSRDLQGTCAISTAAQQANEIGIPVTQDEVLETALRLNLCDEQGSIKIENYPAIMGAVGARCDRLSTCSVDELATLVEQNVDGDRQHSVAIHAPGSFTSWFDPGAVEYGVLKDLGIPEHPTKQDINHMVSMTGVVRSDAEGDDNLLGFLVNDPVRGPAMTVDPEALVRGWEEHHGLVMVVSRPVPNAEV